jgi:uncharacterized surface anchored protein
VKEQTIEGYYSEVTELTGAYGLSVYGIDQAFQINNHRCGKLVIQKKDQETGEFLSGATFQVRNKENGALAGEGTTDSSGKLILYVPAGTYVVGETKAPEGYLAAVGSQTVTVSQNIIDSTKGNYPFTVTFYDIREQYSITLAKRVKVTGDNSCALTIGEPAFLMQLENQATGRIYSQAASFSSSQEADGEGYATVELMFDDLEAGTYIAWEGDWGSYSLEDISGITNGKRQGDQVVFTLKKALGKTEAMATFTNKILPGADDMGEETNYFVAGL